MFTKDPALKRREKWHNLLNKGHKFALMNEKGRIIESAREAKMLNLTLRFRPELSLVDVEKELSKQS